MKALDIANYFIKLGVTLRKLQILLYYSQLWFFKRYKKYLFEDKIMYVYGGVKIESVFENCKYIRACENIPVRKMNNTILCEEKKLFLNEIWLCYGHLITSQLIDLLHEDDAWLISKTNYPNGREIIVDDKTTASYDFTSSNNIPYIPINKNSLGSFSNF